MKSFFDDKKLYCENLVKKPNNAHVLNLWKYNTESVKIYAIKGVPTMRTFSINTMKYKYQRANEINPKVGKLNAVDFDFGSTV